MKISLEEFQPAWENDYLQEKEAIGAILIAFNPTIEHIGSTSVPGLCAKPTIDILVGIEDDSLLDQTIDPMVDSGYTYFRKYEQAMPYRRLFSKLKPLTELTAPRMIDIQDEFIRGRLYISLTNIHIVGNETYHWKRHLAFRDYLRANPEVRDEYGRLKKQLAEQEFIDTNDYNLAKEKFIKETELRAIAWSNAKRDT